MNSARATALGDHHAEPGDQVELSRAGCLAINAVVRRAGAGDRRHQPQVPKVTERSLYRTWRKCHDLLESSMTGRRTDAQ